LSAAGDPPERLALVVDFELFRAELEAALARSDRAKGGRPPYDAVLMFKVLVLLFGAGARGPGAGRQDDLAVP
jgi:transposase, IS5 family